MKEENHPMCYELTLTENYVSDWTFNDAIRELIQNGTDQEILDSSNKFSVDYNSREQILRLSNEKSKLKVNTLLLGRSSKSNNDDTVGQFGEGYKIAALVINRLGKSFTIYNNEKDEIWETRFKNSEKWLEKILAFYIRKEKTDSKGLVVEIGNVSREEYNGICNIWLEMIGYNYGKVDTQYGEILTDEKLAGKIYVNGLYVSTNEDLQYGYNFKPQYIKLERDRKTCDSWSVGNAVALMVADGVVNGGIPFDEVHKMLQARSGDVYYLEFNTYKDDVQELQKMLLERFDEQNPQQFSIPVCDQEEVKKVKAYGGNPVTVPTEIAKLLKDTKESRMKELMELPTSNRLTLKERFNRWYDIYCDRLSTDCKSEVKSLIDEME